MINLIVYATVAYLCVLYKLIEISVKIKQQK